MKTKSSTNWLLFGVCLLVVVGPHTGLIIRTAFGEIIPADEILKTLAITLILATVLGFPLGIRLGREYLEGAE